MTKDEKYMQLALEEARDAYRDDEVPVGCVVVREEKVVARAHNRKEADHNSIHHAEVLALQLAMQALGTRYLEDCTLYVTLEPCLMCAGAIVNCRVGKIVFATRDPKGGAVVSSVALAHIPRINHRPVFEEGVCREEAAELLKKFFKEKRKNREE